MFAIIFTLLMFAGVMKSEAACKGDPYSDANNCASACQPTCAQPVITMCTYQCVVGGCECQTGYILDKTQEDPTSKCIKKEECPGYSP